MKQPALEDRGKLVARLSGKLQEDGVTVPLVAVSRRISGWKLLKILS